MKKLMLFAVMLALVMPAAAQTSTAPADTVTIEQLEAQKKMLDGALAATPLSEVGRRNSLRKQLDEIDRQIADLKKKKK